MCTENDIKKFARMLNEILAPSIQYDIEEEINKLSVNLINNPKILLKENTLSQIKEISKKRIISDRRVIRDKTDDITKLTSLMGKYFDKTLLECGNSTDQISNIKEELEILSISNASHRELGILQSRLIDTVYNIEHSMEKSQQELIQSKTQFDNLQETILKLQDELKHVKEEKNLDYLTNILNRRAFDSEIKKMEQKHKIFNTNYAIVFYDIDYFKSINDTYGHDCGDAVLSMFSKVLKELTRQEDVIARYGGEEFVVLLNYDQEKEIINYLKRVKELIKNNNFIYENSNIEVKFCAGVSFRNKYSTYAQALKSSDDLLYKAKNSGRDKIIVDNNIEI